jgi:hypothetical protein
MYRPELACVAACISRRIVIRIAPPSPIFDLHIISPHPTPHRRAAEIPGIPKNKKI